MMQYIDRNKDQFQEPEASATATKRHEAITEQKTERRAEKLKFPVEVCAGELLQRGS